MPPITRNKTGNKDLQSVGTRLAINLNRSYITVVSDSESISNDELEMTLVLRNKLAQTEYDLSQLKEKMLKLVKLL